MLALSWSVIIPTSWPLRLPGRLQSDGRANMRGNIWQTLGQARPDRPSVGRLRPRLDGNRIKFGRETQFSSSPGQVLPKSEQVWSKFGPTMAEFGHVLPKSRKTRPSSQLQVSRIRPTWAKVNCHRTIWSSSTSGADFCRSHPTGGCPILAVRLGIVRCVFSL